MKIRERLINEDKETYVEVSRVEYLGNYVLRIHFNDGKIRKLSFASFLKNALHPSIKKYENETNFKKYKISDGNINWNNYDMIFPIEDLYTVKIV